MATKTIDFVLNLINKGAGAKEIEKALKDVEKQAHRTEDALQNLSKAGTKLAIMGGAILAPFALAMKKYIDTAKNAEKERTNAAKDAIEKMKSLEKDRLDTIRSTGEKIKDIDKEISDNRIQLSEIARNAEERSRDIRKNLYDTLNDLKQSSLDLVKDYNRRVFDITHPDLTENQRRNIELRRMKEDYIAAQEEIKKKRLEAIQKAAEEEKKVREEQAREIKKVQIENAKLEEQKRAARALEAAILGDIAKKEKQVQADRAAAAAKYNAQYRGVVELVKEWEASQDTIAEVTATVLLPAMREAVKIMKSIADFAKEHPGAIKAVLSVGGFLVVAGGILKTIAEIGGAINFIRGAVGMAQIGSAVAGAGGTVGAGGGIAAAFSAALAPVLTALAPIAIVAGEIAVITLAVVGAAEATRQLVNLALGTNTTWQDIGNTVKQLWFLLKYSLEKGTQLMWKLPSMIVMGIGKYFTSLGVSIFNGLRNFGASISAGLANMANAIRAFFGLPKKADGGMTNGVSIAGEAGREFVMSNSTTKAAENMLGGQLTQQRLLQALAGGGNRKVTYYDNRKIDSSLSANDRRVIRNDVINAIAGAL